MRPHDLIPIRFANIESTSYSTQPTVRWTSKSTTVESFQRAVRKASARGLRLLSYHFSGAKFVAQFGA